MTENKNQNPPIATIALSNIGFAAGIILAYKKQKGFWQYVGYSIGFSLAGMGVGLTIDYLRQVKNKEK